MDVIKALKRIPDKMPEQVGLYIRANGSNYQLGRVAWLQVMGDRVALRLWIFHNYKIKGAEVTKSTEVCRKVSGDDRIIWRNGYWRSTCGGETFQPVYEPKNKRRWYYGYMYEDFKAEDFGKWHEDKKDFFAGCVRILNLEALNGTKYQYCAYPQNCDFMRYLAKYDADPSIEFFGKCGLFPFPSLARQAKKDKAFCRFLRDNATDINLYGPQAATYAYKHKIPIVEARRICEERARAIHAIAEDVPEAVRTCIDKEKLYTYIQAVGRKRGGIYGAMSSYNDYLKAIKTIGLSLEDTKNVFPSDFWRMHDVRISEAASIEAKRDKEKRKQLYEDFANKAQELKRLEWASGEYMVLIPAEVTDLIREGNVLHHCVGKMGYDARVIKGESIIGFIRNAEEPDRPLYTVEYKPSQKKISQCYGDHDVRPEQTVIDIANEWAEFVTKQLKKTRKEQTA